MNTNMHCSHCQTLLTYSGRQLFRPGEAWAIWQTVFPHTPGLDVFICPNCRKIELFALPTEVTLPPPPPPPVVELIPTAPPDQLLPVAVNQLLKLIPAVSTVEDVKKHCGLPLRHHNSPHGLVLSFLAEDDTLPHVVLLDEASQLVKMVAIHNFDYQFTLEDLKPQFGEPELALTTHGNEHWLFPGKGIGFIAEGRDENYIMYFQVMPETITLENYYQLDGYAEEVFSA